MNLGCEHSELTIPRRRLLMHGLQKVTTKPPAAQQIAITVSDQVGHPESLTLNYWVEADHDVNRNGEPDPDEYVAQTMTNYTEDVEKVFFGMIDDSRNPNMARVSYYVSGHDPVGNLIIGDDGPGFAYDLTTYLTRKDMTSVFTGLNWEDHEDGGDVYSGTDQSISVGLVDANGIIDFEYISLIFDLKGPTLRETNNEFRTMVEQMSGVLRVNSLPSYRVVLRS